MVKVRRLFIIVVAVLLCVVFVACASTPKQKQLLSIETFNGLYKQYLDEYDRQPDEIRAEWKVKIDPYWREASLAIDAYLAITDPASTEAQKKMAIYNAAKNQALRLLMTYGIEIKEE